MIHARWDGSLLPGNNKARQESRAECKQESMKRKEIKSNEKKLAQNTRMST